MLNSQYEKKIKRLLAKIKKLEEQQKKLFSLINKLMILNEIKK
tara:strand:- start:204 stop:332 length:129 start_codon:yes stop_codon:yes gene_type:complete